MSQAALKVQPERRRDVNAEARRQAAIVEFVRWVAPQVVILGRPGQRRFAIAG